MSVTQIKNTSFFQPTAVTGCQLWLDGADTSSLVLSGSNVTQWNDKSGNGYSMTNNAGTTTLATASLNSLTTVYTPSGTNTRITNFVGRTKCTMFIVAKAATSRYLLALNGGFLYTANDSLLYFQPPAGNYLDIIDSVGLATPVVSNNTWFILCIGYDNATSNTANPYTINGTTRSTVIIPRGTPGILTDQNITSTFYINSVNGTNSYDSVYTAEILYYNNTLTTAQRQQMEGYLAWKWGLQQSLPSTHPFARTPSFATALYFPKAVPKITGTSGKHPVFMAGLQLWLDAADTSTLVLSGSSVTQWSDKSGNGNNGTANTPVALNSAINNLPALTFTTSEYIGGNISITGNTLTVFSTFKVSSLPQFGRVISLASLGGDDYNNTSSTGILNYGSAAMGPMRVSQYVSSATPLNTSVVHTVYFDGTNTYVYTNGGTASSMSSSGNFSVSRYNLGRSTNTADTYSSFSGFTGEVIIYNTLLTATQRQEVEGYLAWKWGLQSSLAAGHSYQTLAPIVIPYVNPVVRTSNNIRFSPTSIGGCQLWLDAADATSITGTTTVTQWRDKSGNSRHLGALSGTTSYSSNTIQLTNSAMSVSSPVNLTNVIVFIIVKTTGGNNQTVFGGRPNTNVNWSSPDGFGFYMDHQSSIRYYGGEDAAGRTLSFSANTSIPRLFSFQTIGTSVSGRMNGTSQSTGTLSSARTSTAQGFVLGGEWNGSSYGNFIVNASIYEIIVYNSEISIAQLQQVEGYLAWKWALQTSLPTSHLYYKFPAGP